MLAGNALRTATIRHPFKTNTGSCSVTLKRDRTNERATTMTIPAETTKAHDQITVEILEAIEIPELLQEIGTEIETRNVDATTGTAIAAATGEGTTPLEAQAVTPNGSKEKVAKQGRAKVKLAKEVSRVNMTTLRAGTVHQCMPKLDKVRQVLCKRKRAVLTIP